MADMRLWRTEDTKDNAKAFVQHQSTLAYPDEKGLIYDVVHSFGRQDKPIKRKSNPQARKKWPRARSRGGGTFNHESQRGEAIHAW
ncbi:TPA: hypothetical protein AB5F24_002401 [Vibrio cholerae]